MHAKLAHITLGLFSLNLAHITLGFLSSVGTFSHKVDQTWFVLHETCHTILFGIYYCVEVVGIENKSYMLEITC